MTGLNYYVTCVRVREWSIDPIASSFVRRSNGFDIAIWNINRLNAVNITPAVVWHSIFFLTNFVYKILLCFFFFFYFRYIRTINQYNEYKRKFIYKSNGKLSEKYIDLWKIDSQGSTCWHIPNCNIFLLILSRIITVILFYLIYLFNLFSF